MGRLDDVLAAWESMVPAMTEGSGAVVPLPPDRVLAACINDLRRAMDPSCKPELRVPKL